MINYKDACAHELADFALELKLMQDHYAARPLNGSDEEFVAWFRTLKEHGERFAAAERRLIECVKRNNP